MQDIRQFAGQEGWFTPSCLAMGVGGGKPPFLTCKLAGLDAAFWD
jgi:hypothetical protein